MSLKDGSDQRLTMTYEESEDIPSNQSTAATMGDVINRRYGRREVLRGALAMTAISAVAGPAAAIMAKEAKAAMKGSFDFEEIEAGLTESHAVAPGYKADILIRWGDKVEAGAPDFDPMNQTAAAQAKQFGYNNDYIGYIPLPLGSNSSGHGLLVVNQEYTNEELMFPGVGKQGDDFMGMTKELVDIEMAAHGGSVIEVKKQGGSWTVVEDSKYARRITANGTEMMLSGPAAGHARVKTSADPSGKRVIGTFNNCAGGVTPWGTYLMAEENFHGYFSGEVAEDHPEAANHSRYGTPGGWYAWSQYYDRFDVSKEPNEPNRFGWVVEVDPSDPASTPVKRTAMGRFKHEGAESLVNKDGRLVVYMGDDQRFDYLYKFVSAGQVNLNDRAANADLLDDGTLYVAKFGDDGKVTWMPIVFGEGPLTPMNGFESQADVLIETRRAADLLEATPMDRPEDVEPNPVTGKVYVMLTNNSKREEGNTNAANPRAKSPGHIVEITTPDMDHAATEATWDILVLCGDPAEDETATWGKATSENGWFVAPDNCAIDHKGRLWVSTDGNKAGGSNRNDGLWAMETEGDLRGSSFNFFRCPIGAEMCGPKFTPDGKTLFVAVQHPADAGVDKWEPFGRKSTFEDPATRWPDFKDGMPPRPSVVVITREDGGEIG